MIRVGYACVNTQLPSASRTCRLKNASDENILSLSRQNLDALKQILLWNRENGIQLFRISSDTIPFASHAVNTLPWWRTLKAEFAALGRIIAQFNMRVSMHPGQFTVLNSLNPKVVAASEAELEYHCRVLNALGLDRHHKIVIHIGGTYGDKTSSMERFIKNFAKLPSRIRNRLVIENDEKNYTVRDVLEIADELQIPMVFDLFHHRCNPSFHRKSLVWTIEKIATTWRREDGPAKLHYSNQQKGRPKGTHSQAIDISDFRHFYRRIQHMRLDIMLEVKNKEQSVLEVYRRIPSLKNKYQMRQ